jgi:hypothetical protein
LVKLVRYDERTFGLPVYDRMRQAIIEAYRVDEVANIRDKASGSQILRQARQGPQNERLACDIQPRAERKPGQLLGISKDQSSKWQQLADVPDDVFEAACAWPASRARPAS